MYKKYVEGWKVWDAGTHVVVCAIARHFDNLVLELFDEDWSLSFGQSLYEVVLFFIESREVYGFLCLPLELMQKGKMLSRFLKRRDGEKARAT